jgi:hypothetical protein
VPQLETRLQAKGSLAETNVRSLLEAAQAERATGTLTLRSDGNQPTTLYFLFGHLFHAVGGDADGDDAVVHALGWRSGEFDFDAKAKLPADESVKASIPELLNRSAGQGQGSAAQAPPAWTPPPSETKSVPQALAQGETRRAPQQPPDPSRYPAPPAQPAYEPAATQRSAGSAGGSTRQAVSRAPARAPQAQLPASPPVTSRGLKFRPMPRYTREPIPTPYGELMYDSLKTSFVDFPRLITTLERESFTGYIRLLADGPSGLIYFRDGTPLECVYDNGTDPTEQGRTALLNLNQEVTRGQGVLDVVGLSPELVDGLYHVTVAQPIYSQLYAGWIEMESFLQFLCDRKLTGSLIVRARSGTGVIIMDEGQLAGAYTSRSREVSGDADGVLALCDDPEAMIEVKAASEMERQSLDVSELTGQRRGASPAWSQAASAGPPPGGPPQAPAAQQPSVAAPAQPQSPYYGGQDQPGSQQQAHAAVPMPATVGAPQNGPAYSPQGAHTSVRSAADAEQLVGELLQMTEEALGNRARKVKDVLANAERSRAGLESAIDQIPSISILFVDASRLESLANDLRAKLQSYPL